MYELCCDMIDLLINMSEIYGKPNKNNVRAIQDDDDDDEEYINERANLNDDDDDDDDDDEHHHEWNIESPNETYDENNVPLNEIRSNSYVNSMSNSR